ncbi:MAG: TolC family protein, partial [Candidatus Saganbacteria bacterium]|nr:TolC family protein [Candidatus Saganbacteria bacterium]
FDVTSAYQGVIYAKRSIILAMDALSLANDHKREAETMLNVGVVTKADTLRSEVAVADAEYKLTIAKNALIQAENAFNSLLGRDLNEEVILSDEDFRLDEIQPPSYEELLKIAYGNRSDWLSFGYGKESSDKTVGVAMSDFWPSFAMVGTYGYDYTRFPEEGTTNDIKSWTAMLSGTWKLFDGLGTPQKAKEALANKESLLEDEKSLVKAIEMEVKDAVLSMNAALDSLRCSKKALDLAEENHRVARLRYTSGVGTNIEVIDAETALSGSKLNRLKAEFDYEQAKAKINKVVGKDIFKISKRELSSVGIALNGLVKFIELEGGFVGFIDDKGNKYNIFGDKVSEISREIGKSKDGRKVQIVGQPKKEVATIQMWGTPFEVKSFRWL